MAVLFSAVTLSADNNQVEFLTAGIPRDADDLEGWAAFEDFMDELASEQEVGVHVEAYLYGEGETVKATPEEVAYCFQYGFAEYRRFQSDVEIALSLRSLSLAFIKAIS